MLTPGEADAGGQISAKPKKSKKSKKEKRQRKEEAGLEEVLEVVQKAPEPLYSEKNRKKGGKIRVRLPRSRNEDVLLDTLHGGRGAGKSSLCHCCCSREGGRKSLDAPFVTPAFSCFPISTRPRVCNGEPSEPLLLSLFFWQYAECVCVQRGLWPKGEVRSVKGRGLFSFLLFLDFLGLALI